ncbi:hypothetical protein ACKVMT_17275 [Halobacteriales archaeon Cl-PHB]
MTTASGDPVRILHVDDDPGIRELTAEMLEHEEVRFVVSTSPAARSRPGASPSRTMPRWTWSSASASTSLTAMPTNET